MQITRVLVTAYGLLFGALGLGFWAAPTLLAQRFSIEALSISGLSTIRADLGGLFLALSALCLVGAWTRRQPLLVACGTEHLEGESRGC